MPNEIRAAVARMNDELHLGLRKHARRLLENLLIACDDYGIVTGITQEQFATIMDCSKRCIEYAFADLRAAKAIAESVRDSRTGTMAHALSAWVAEYVSNV